MAIENFNQKPQEQENPISPERQKIIDEVTNLGKATGNPFNFEDFGSESSSLEKIKLNSKTLEGLDGETINIVKKMLWIVKKYIERPIFTDKFHKNHGNNKHNPEDNTRLRWEKDNLDKLNEEAMEYYHSNALGHNNISTMTILDVLLTDIKNSEIKDKVSKLTEKLPEELKDTEDGKLKYYNSENEDKVRLVKQAKEILKQIVSLLTE